MKRSIFYNLALLNDGSGNVESLGSYIQRLSVLHNIKPLTLFTELMARSSDHKFTPHAVANISYCWNIHGGAKNGRKILSDLQRSTSVDLSNSTFARFTHVFSDVSLVKTKGSFYCPDCISNKDKILYSKLLWECQIVSCCPDHKIKLRSSKVCGSPKAKHLPVQQRPISPGVCNQCGSMRFTCIDANREPASESEVWIALQVKRLIESYPPLHGYSFDLLISGINQAVDYLYEGSPVIATRKTQLGRTTVFGWLHNNHKPSLSQLIQFCHNSNLDLVELMLGRCVLLCGEHRAPQQPFKLNRIYRRSDLSDASVSKCIRRAAVQPTPPTVRSVAKSLGIHPDTPRRRFPEETTELVRARKAYLLEERKRKYAFFVSSYKAAANKLIAIGKGVTRKTLQENSGLITFESSLRNVALAEVIEAYRNNDGNH